MFPDHSLMPKEAIRLAALGLLAEAPRSYSDLANAMRSFISHVIGPNLDLMGSSIQMLCVEGLAEEYSCPEAAATPAANPTANPTAATPGRDSMLRITDSGREQLQSLLLASIRTPFNDVNKLVLALKMRFFASLSADDKARQIALIEVALEEEIARLEALCRERLSESGARDMLARWLTHDLDQLRASLDWFRALESA